MRRDEQKDESGHSHKGDVGGDQKQLTAGTLLWLDDGHRRRVSGRNSCQRRENGAQFRGLMMGKSGEIKVETVAKDEKTANTCVEKVHPMAG